MGNGSVPDEQQKKKRGRPPGTRPKGSEATAKKGGHRNKIAANSPTYTSTKESVTSTANVEEKSLQDADDDAATPFSLLLQTIMHRDRAELSRVARELVVAENTVYRWMNGTSEPRTTHLKRLPEVIPEHRTQLIAAINQTFGEILGTPVLNTREVSKEVYQRVLELVANSQDDDTRFWQISEIIFSDALEHLDTNNQG
ncbi:hypothetical protein [Dictyobacter kobayashii]|uniref:Uncharacterized protein n=1 Tax=Dictyobacter kobayashii TaxID=2014872 RepID=A0A402AJN8_9CHLR|nr:hypothetical protein [Dictyobacter kobayashii]GCE19316.1 hypothetical protein KDK_31160 [Dictyobacter kobayashii]